MSEQAADAIAAITQIIRSHFPFATPRADQSGTDDEEICSITTLGVANARLNGVMCRWLGLVVKQSIATTSVFFFCGHVFGNLSFFTVAFSNAE